MTGNASGIDKLKWLPIRSRRQEAAWREVEIPHLLDPEQFLREVEREKLRTDRTGIPFLLLLFRIEGGEADCAAVREGYRKLSELCGTRTRRTDCRGWYADRRGTQLGVLLWNTAAAQARPLIQDLCREFERSVEAKPVLREAGLKLGLKVFGYPEENAETEAAEFPSSGNGNGRTQHNGKKDEKDEKIGGRMLQTKVPRGEGTETRARGQCQWPGTDCDSDRDSDWEVRVQPLQRLWAHPLPRWKRALDITLASGMILAFLPMLVFIAIAVKLSSRGPILYRQDRVGAFGRIFKCFKFRSMRVDFDTTIHQQHLQTLIASGANGSEGEQPLRKLDSCNPKITRVGRIIRSTHLDELPQLLNVLRGEMSLVGPRPCIPYEAESYQPWHRQRFEAMPGITGLWQVKGKNKTTFKEMIRLDIHYIQQCSLLLDAHILLMTIPTIIGDVVEMFASPKRREARELQQT